MAGRSTDTLRIGIAGLGTAGRLLIPAIEKRADCTLVAVADLISQTRESFAATYGAKACPDLEALIALPEVDAVYIATPTHLHVAHTLAAIEAGKHVLVEKPMAASIADAQRMTEAAERRGVHLAVGHTHAYDTPIQTMREIIAGGELGQLKLINASYYSDWFYRPRLPKEFDTSLGGGVVFRQGSHQFDIVRVLGGGMLASVRATTFDLDPKRPGIGAYTALLTFVDGAVATVTYNGYGLFGSFELYGNIDEAGSLETTEQKVGTARRAIYDRVNDDERDAKRMRIERHTRIADPPYHGFFGLTIVSCERGDIRQSPRGLYVYTLDGRAERVFPVERDHRTPVLDEFYDSIVGRRAALHDGRWGIADVEVCLAVIESSRSGREVSLRHQVPATDAALTAQPGR
jgi:phthalate 4,5-cis-dihydrodiol dehydrogenase